MSSLNFVDNLEFLRTITSVALERVQDNRNEFVTSATSVHVRETAKCICELRKLATQLESEFKILEFMILEHQNACKATPRAIAAGGDSRAESCSEA
jgi:hypothetical protein